MRLIFTLVLFFNIPAFAQEVINIDSLQAIYNNSRGLRIRTEIAIEISKQYNRTNIDSNAKYLAVAKRLVTELNDEKLTATYDVHQGKHFKITG